jgi:hypothetical protein
MPITALLLPDPKTPEKKYKFKVFTKQLREEGFQVITHGCDDNWVQNSVLSSALKDGNEMDYHRDLRLEAQEKGQLVIEHSTNPELHPE